MTHPVPHALMALVAGYYGLALGDLTGPSRARRAAGPRQIAMVLCYDLLGATAPAVAAAFGRRCHATVLHALRQVRARADTDPLYAHDYTLLEARARAHLTLDPAGKS